MVSSAVQSLLDNEKQLSLAAINSLLKITNNILNHPNEDKYRRINLSSDLVEKSILPAVGALELLFLMGFEEGDDKLILPLTSPLDKVMTYKNELDVLKSERFPTSNLKTSTNKISKSTNEVSYQILADEMEMKNELIHRSDSVLQFESPSLQERAKTVIPIKQLSEKAKEKLALLDKDISTSPEYQKMDFQDCLLLELLAWFKEDYFSWFDQGWCDICQKNMKFLKYIPSSPDELLKGASNVELHHCETCGKDERFPRFINPGELMETKKGRCMEWAACFTFFCRTLGFDARYVVDATDHVWTEIFSKSQDRWLHADACENKLDTPLMYEKGWGKKLSYIFAYSKDEVVDCVWRYSSNHKDICSRRTRSREDWLAATVFTLNQEKQSSFTVEKKKFLEQRLVKEIVEFFSPCRKEKEGENEGRSSGSLAWRLNRGEIQESSVSFTFSASDEELMSKEMIVKYSPSRDVYILPVQNNSEMKGWQNGTFACSHIFRKHEHDWKIVYLARNEGCLEGLLKWKFDWSNHKDLKLKSVLIVFQTSAYENGAVHWQLCSGDLCFQGNKNGVLELSANELDCNIGHFELSAVLSGGEGVTAWQHAQLFRQGEKDKEFPFFVHIKFD